jgi:hypothetical protein
MTSAPASSSACKSAVVAVFLHFQSHNLPQSAPACEVKVNISAITAGRMAGTLRIFHCFNSIILVKYKITKITTKPIRPRAIFPIVQWAGSVFPQTSQTCAFPATGFPQASHFPVLIINFTSPRLRTKHQHQCYYCGAHDGYPYVTNLRW